MLEKARRVAVTWKLRLLKTVSVTTRLTTVWRVSFV